MACLGLLELFEGRGWGGGGGESGGDLTYPHYRTLRLQPCAPTPIHPSPQMTLEGMFSLMTQNSERRGWDGGRTEDHVL